MRPTLRDLPDHPRSRPRAPTRRAAAAVELAVVLPFILVLVLGTLEIGRLLEVRQVLANAVREGGRQAASGQLSNSQVQQVVLNYLNDAGLPTTHAVVTVADLTAPGTDATNAGQLDRLQVVVSLPFADVRWLPTTLVTSASTQVSAAVIWYSMQNQTYPTGITVPPGN